MGLSYSHPEGGSEPAWAGGTAGKGRRIPLSQDTQGETAHMEGDAQQLHVAP